MNPGRNSVDLTGSARTTLSWPLAWQQTSEICLSSLPGEVNHSKTF